ncbi:MAG: thioredoxin domain-containing protein [Candidatus Nealsonbacteria bacterium]|nr:thioredoxin domain-containing protein [Candidatus Nealsonbacteria bacterium]
MNAPPHAAESTAKKPPAEKPTNRLAGQTSPYLLQHVHNPVNWYPWGKEALARARKENKPIFLSIGYSACHWCHVMERESFEDAETAKILNEHFIAIKVDREERPDVDEIYMTAVQAMTGRGGWPLSVFLTPDLKPFFGGTYFPPETRHGMPGFKTVLTRVAEIWRTQPDDVAHNSEQLVKAIRANATIDASESDLPDDAVLSGAAVLLSRQFDPEWGGFGGAPKFPPSGAIALLLRQHAHSGDDRLLRMATVTLDRMARGGMYDQLGGGFHRYSVDARWLVPHFEKMLYDNALLCEVYLEAWQVTGNDLYRRVAAGILDYVVRDMTDARGAFHCAEDADSEGVEGKFYVWQSDEIMAVLGDKDGTLFCDYYGVSAEGNFEGHNILNVPRSPAEFLRGKDLTEAQFQDRLAEMRQKLLDRRSRRVRPGKDNKILAAWNGMMISALARGYQVLGDQRYLDAARNAADVVLTDMVRDGQLQRAYRKTGTLPGYLDDYAEMADGLVDLYQADFDLGWLRAADELTGRMVADFWDTKDGSFFFTSAAHKDLLVRTKPFYDGAVPAGNSTATLVLLRLAKLLDNRDYADKAETVLRSMGNEMQARPQAALNLLRALDFHLRPTREIAVVGSATDRQTRNFLDIIHGRFLPNKILALREPGTDESDAIDEFVPLLKGKQMIAGKTTVYVCENYTCKAPVNDPAALERILTTPE